ncbi:MAG TPA: response regulator transcription factor [Flavobacteriaceae bacterium]|nr:response regulator transcription factor [Flavobacteriaceae bacterium]
MKRILIADPHPITRAGIRSQLLETNPKCKIVGLVSNGDELVSKVLSKKPNLLITELNMDGMHGFLRLKEVAQKLPEMQIIVFSSFPAALYEKQCLDSGAISYLSKNISTRTFQMTVQKVIDGRYNGNNKKLKKDTLYKPKKPLSSREVEVLQLLIKGYRNKDIASSLELNEKTVSTYKSRLLKKLKVNSLADLIKFYKSASPPSNHASQFFGT